MSQQPGSQRGIALLMVLVAILIMALIAARMSAQFILDYRKSEYTIVLPQLRWLLMAGEQQGIEQLQHYAHGENTFVNLTQPWTQPFVMAIDAGRVNTSVTSEQNCFNLNTVANFTSATSNSTPARAVLQILLGGYGLDRKRSDQLITLLADYLEADRNKEQVTESKTPQDAQRSEAIPWLLDSRELKLLSGFELFSPPSEDSRLCVHPDKELAISINTLTMQDASLLSALSLDTLSENDIRQLLEQRPEQGWKNIEALKVTINKLWPARKESLQIMLSMLSVDSQNFVIKSQASIAGQKLIMNSFVHYDRYVKKLNVWKRRYVPVD